MTLSDYAALSTAVSGLAVTASLIYLALQTHQNARHTRAQIHQGRIAALRDIFLACADPDIARAILVSTGGEPTLREVQQYQFQSICGARFYGWQDTYSQYRSGLLDESFFQQMCAGAAMILRDEAARAAWTFFRVPGTPFAAFIDEIAARQAADAG